MAIDAHRREGTSGEVVVLIHGALDRGSSFARVRRRLGKHTTLAYDRRGYADSVDLPVEGGMDRHVGDLAALLHAEDLDDRRVVLAGHSFGGLVALSFAASHPHLTKSVVVFEPPLTWMPWWSGSSRSITQPEVAPAEAAERFFRVVVGNKAWERMPEPTKTRRRAEGPALVSDLLAARRQAPFAPDDVLAPVVVARGEHAIERHVQAGDLLAQWFDPGSDPIVIPGAHHGAHMSHPDSFAELVELAIHKAKN